VKNELKEIFIIYMYENFRVAFSDSHSSKRKGSSLSILTSSMRGKLIPPLKVGKMIQNYNTYCYGKKGGSIHILMAVKMGLRVSVYSNVQKLKREHYYDY